MAEPRPRRMTKRRPAGRRWPSYALVSVVLAAAPSPADAGWFDWMWGKKQTPNTTTVEANPNDDLDSLQRAVKVKFDVTGGDADITTLIEESSGLEDLAEAGGATSDAILRAALSERDRILGILYTRGLYGAIVQVQVAGTAVTDPAIRDAIEAAVRRGNVHATVTVMTGRVFTFGTVRVETTGNGPAPVGQAETGLVTGAVASSTDIIAAEDKLVVAMQRLGYPLATVGSRTVIANHANHTVEVVYPVTPGRQATFGRVIVEGTDKMRPEVVASRAPFREGEPYRPGPLDAYARDLRNLEVFASVRVAPGEQIAPDGTIPIVVRVTERKLHYLGASASWSSEDGAVISAFWGHRNLFGGGERLRFDAEVSRLFVNDPADLQYRIGFTFTKPGIWSYKNDLILASHFVRETPKAYTRTGVDNEITLLHHYNEQTDVSIGLAPSFSTIEDPFGKHYYGLVGVPLAANSDTTDNKLDPTKGYRFVGTFTPYGGEIGDTNTMLRTYASLSAYHAFDANARFILAGKVEVGSIVGPSLESTPANLRFYAGGGGSIRGYAFQAASPRTVYNQITGGRSLFTTQLELRAKVTETIGVVPFVDFGSAYKESYPDFSEPLKVGVGAGLRYYTAIGPIRFDFAVPLQKEHGDDNWAAYLSLGQAF